MPQKKSKHRNKAKSKQKSYPSGHQSQHKNQDPVDEILRHDIEEANAAKVDGSRSTLIVPSKGTFDSKNRYDRLR